MVTNLKIWIFWEDIVETFTASKINDEDQPKIWNKLEPGLYHGYGYNIIYME